MQKRLFSLAPLAVGGKGTARGSCSPSASLFVHGEGAARDGCSSTWRPSRSVARARGRSGCHSPLRPSRSMLRARARSNCSSTWRPCHLGAPRRRRRGRGTRAMSDASQRRGAASDDLLEESFRVGDVLVARACSAAFPSESASSGGVRAECVPSLPRQLRERTVRL